MKFAIGESFPTRMKGWGGGGGTEHIYGLKKLLHLEDTDQVFFKTNHVISKLRFEVSIFFLF